jgi:hypothetical protein
VPADGRGCWKHLAAAVPALAIGLSTFRTSFSLWEAARLTGGFEPNACALTTRMEPGIATSSHARNATFMRFGSSRPDRSCFLQPARGTGAAYDGRRTESCCHHQRVSAALVKAYRDRDSWVVASARSVKLLRDPAVLAIPGDAPIESRLNARSPKAYRGSVGSIRSSTIPASSFPIGSPVHEG